MKNENYYNTNLNTLPNINNITPSNANFTTFSKVPLWGSWAGVLGAVPNEPLPIVIEADPFCEQVMTLEALMSFLIIFEVLQSKDKVPEPSFNP